MGLEHILSGALFMPFLLTPFAILFWYAARGERNPQEVAAETEILGMLE